MKTENNDTSRIQTIFGYSAIFAVIAVAVAVVFSVINSRSVEVISGDYSQFFSDSTPKIIVIGNSTCPYCAKAREFLREKNVHFDDQNIDTSTLAAKNYSLLQGESIPVIITRNHRINGFSPVKLQEIIDQEGIKKVQ